MGSSFDFSVDILQVCKGDPGIPVIMYSRSPEKARFLLPLKITTLKDKWRSLIGFEMGYMTPGCFSASMSINSLYTENTSASGALRSRYRSCVSVFQFR